MKSIAILLRVCFVMAITMQATNAYLQIGQFSTAANNYLKKRTDAFMTITGYSLTPDVTTD